jgi:hypothetical protein
MRLLLIITLCHSFINITSFSRIKFYDYFACNLASAILINLTDLITMLHLIMLLSVELV